MTAIFIVLFLMVVFLTTAIIECLHAIKSSCHSRAKFGAPCNNEKQ